MDNAIEISLTADASTVPIEDITFSSQSFLAELSLAVVVIASYQALGSAPCPDEWQYLVTDEDTEPILKDTFRVWRNFNAL